MKNSLFSEVVLTGKWSEDIAWDFYLTNVVPPTELCTSVMCVPLLSTYEVVMTRNHRGWELPGGHIEQGETIEQALVRELQEEVGYTPETWSIFGYRKITARVPIPHAQQEGFYPFPTAYIPYYVAMSELPMRSPSGAATEIFEAKAYKLEDLGDIREEFKQITEFGLQAFQEKHAG